MYTNIYHARLIERERERRPCSSKSSGTLRLVDWYILSEVTNTPQYFETSATTRIYLSTQRNILKELNLFQRRSENFYNPPKFTFRSVENDKLCAFCVAPAGYSPCLRPSYIS
jgi:hypothetical protein